MTAKTRFYPGDRVQLNILGVKRSPRMSSRVGTVMGILSRQCVVHFDGNKTFTTLHDTYLERVPDGGPGDE
jgi:hypothetical protein